MAVITLVSDELPSFVAEASRRLIQQESSLPTPLTSASQSFGENRLTVTASLPGSIAIDPGTGDSRFAIANTTPADTLVLTGTPLSDVTTNSLAEALFVAALRLDAAEAAKISSGSDIPAGSGTSYSIANGVATFSSILPITYSVDAAGAQVVTVSNYAAI